MNSKYCGETYMTPQEQQLLSDLLDRIIRMPAPARDAEADAMIQKALGSRPDALYILTQLALIHEINLKQAQQQIQDLQQRPAPAQPSSFLGGPWSAQSAQQQSAAPAPSSFLRSALSTASGIVAGEVAFSALRSLFGSGSYSMGAGSGASFLGNAPREETIVNNYYDSDSSANDGSGSNNDYADSSDNDLVDADDSGDYST